MVSRYATLIPRSNTSQFHVVSVIELVTLAGSDRWWAYPKILLFISLYLNQAQRLGWSATPSLVSDRFPFIVFDHFGSGIGCPFYARKYGPLLLIHVLV